MPQATAMSRIEAPSEPLLANMRAASSRICRTRSEDSPSFSGPSLVVEISAITFAPEPDFESKRRRHPAWCLETEVAKRCPSHPHEPYFWLTDRSSNHVRTLVDSD